MPLDKKREPSFSTMKRFVLLALLMLCQANDEHHPSQVILMSYNVMFVPRLMVHNRDQITRAHLLAKANFLRTSDILCLQEVFQPQPSQILLDSLTDTYPYSTPILGNKEDEDAWDETWNRNIGRSSLKFLSGGITILSKYPIIHAAQYFYRNSCGGHTFARSGFIYARIWYGKNEVPIHVIGTHLQPSNNRGCYLATDDQVREKQMNEITGFIDARNISKNELVFLLGDFNIDRYNTEQYQAMIEILRVENQVLHPSSIPCTWDSSFNAMTNEKHQENQLLDYILVHQDHRLNHSLWYNLVVDLMASEQWHLLGRGRMFFNTRNRPLMELSDHYPIVGFFNLTRQKWPEKPSGVLTYVQFVTVDTHFPIVIVDRNIRISNASTENGSVFLLTNNATPRRHRCLKSEQYILLLDGYQPEFYLSNAKYFRLKYGMEQVNRYLKIIQTDNSTHCITTNSTFILQTQLSTGIYYINSSSSHLCACTKEKDQAQQFRLIEVKRKDVSCTITH